jgi:hypothetical protein
MSPTLDAGRVAAVCGLCLLLVTAGCAGAGDAASTGGDAQSTPDPDPGASTVATTSTAAQTPPPGLESMLFDLVRASNRSAFADRHDLSYRDGAVLVVVELGDGESLPEGYATEVVDRRSGSVAAYVPVDDLVDLAGESAVDYVRTPRRAEPSSLSNQ